MAVSMSDYKVLFSSLMEKSGLSSQELEKKLYQKIDSLGHFINEDVALRLVARDLNISLSNGDAKLPCIQIVDLVPNMTNINIELIIEVKGIVKTFVKKDGTPGKLLRTTVSDSSGKASLVAWDEQTKSLEPLTNGSKVLVRSAYTKNGLKGDIEIHLGNRSRLEILYASTSNDISERKETHRGWVWRISDLVVFNRRDGSKGTLASFLLKEGEEFIRVLIWDPQKEKLSDNKEGMYIEVRDGYVKTDMLGKPELHVNNVEAIEVSQDDVIQINRGLARLPDIQPNMNGMDLEATVDTIFDISTTYNGKSFLKMLLVDGETYLPLTLWNDKALKVSKIAQKGSTIRLEDCYSKLGTQGLELGINRWGKVIIK
jgi:ssDNA-binding replication factor A large subunit